MPMGHEPHIIAGMDLQRHWQRQDALLEFHKLFSERATIDERAIAIVGAAFIRDDDRGGPTLLR